MKRIKQTIAAAAGVLLCLVLAPGGAGAFDLGPLDASFFVRNQTYVRAWHGPDDLMQCRNELNLELGYSKIPHFNFFLQLRPFYDTAYDWSNEGTGGNAGYLRSGWAHNLGRNNDRDPLFREAYVDFTMKNFTLRAGRQIVSWGKSDGVYMLDIINPFNLRNPAEFNEENVKIPLWMLNLTYAFKPGDLQLLWIFNYQENIFPGHRISERGYHDWTMGTVALSNDVYVFLDDYFKNVLGVPEGCPVYQKDPSQTFENQEWGVRWSSMWKGFNYSLNYFYTWSDFTDWPNTGNAFTATSFLRRADRLSVFGFSVDRYLAAPKLVVRLESAYTKGQPFYYPDTNIREQDQVGYMLGFDRWVHVDWNLSFQVWQNFIVKPAHAKNVYIGPGANVFDPNTGNVANGLRDPIITNLTAYLSHDGFFMGDTGHLEAFFLQNLDQGDQWLWTKFRYELNDVVQVALGASLYWGNNDDPFGQWKHNDCIFTEIKFGWK